jgi:hypothetical protein
MSRLEEVAMQLHGRKSIPEKPDSSRARREAIADFWNELRISDETGMTTWEVLATLERNVVDCLLRSDLARAESYTAEAMHRIAGHFDDD